MFYLTFYSEWQPESRNKLIDNILMFTENHTKYTERTLSANVSQEYNIFKLKINN